MSFGGGSNGTTAQVLNGIPINSATYGTCIPLVYGTNRVPIMLLWYDDFQAAQGGGGSKGGSNGSGSYSYSASCILGLCEGPITSIGTVWQDKDVTTITDLGLTVAYGTATQAPWVYLTDYHSAQAVPYNLTAYVAKAGLNLGGSAALPNYTFQITGLLPYTSGISDAEPSAILVDYCTDPNHGANFPYLNTSQFQGTGVTTWQSYCIAMGFLFSPFENTQRAAVEFIKDLMTMTNSNAVWSAGLLNIIPYADTSVAGNGRTFTPNLEPIYEFFDDDFLPNGNSNSGGNDPVIVTRTPTTDTYNVVRVEFQDAGNAYNTGVAEASDARDIALNGVRVMSTVSLHAITQVSVARQVAQLILQRQLYIRNTFQFSVRSDYCLLEPMDLVSINDTTLGIVDKLVRITEIDDDENDVITITAEDVLVGSASAPLYNWVSAQGYAANFAAAPASVAAPLIFTTPPNLVSAVGGYELCIAVGPATGDPWGGCDVYMSMDNATYIFAGTIAGNARYGTLTANLPSVPDPDSSSTLAIAFENNYFANNQILPGSAADYANLRTLMFVDGEIIAYENATQTSTGHYNLGVLRRGQYGSQPAAHASGCSWARIDEQLFRVAIDPGLAGQTIYFKFCSWNAVGRATQSQAVATAYSHVISLNNGQPTAEILIGVGVACIGTTAYKSAATTAWDSHVYSQQAYTNGAYVTFYPAQNTLAFFMGLNNAPSTDGNYTGLDYAFYCTNGGTLQMYEGGTGTTTTYGTYAAGDALTITYDGFYVRYSQNGAIIRQIAAPSNQTFVLDSAFYQPQATAARIDFGPFGSATPALYTVRGNAVVSDSGAQKIGGTNSWDSDAISITAYKTCNFVFKPNDTTGYVLAGLTTAPISAASLSGGSGNTEISYAFYFDAGSLVINESGTNVTTVGTYTGADRFAIVYDGSTVTFLKNGNSVYTVSASGLNMFAAVSLYSPGTGVNSLDFGPGTTIPVIDTGQINSNAATDIVSTTVSSATLTSAEGSTYLSWVSFPGGWVASVTVPAQLTDCVVTIIADFQARDTNFATPSTPFGMGYSLVLAQSGNNQGIDYCYELPYNTSSLYPYLSFSCSRTFSINAGAVATGYLYANWDGGNGAGGAGTSPEFQNIRLRAEIIKR
jgi:hypothetical protein